MISSKKMLIASSLFIAAGTFSAQAEGLEFNVDAGAEVIHLSGASNAATTYYGLRGSLEACDAKGTGFYLCCGVTASTTLDKMSKTTIAFGNVKSSLDTIGGYAKIRTNLVEGWAFASYAGVSRFNFKHEGPVSGTSKEHINVLLAGVELDKQIKGNVSLSLKGEIGRFIGTTTNRNVYSFSPGLKVKF